MGSISIDPAELDSAATTLQEIAAAFEATDSRLSFAALSGPAATAAALPEFEQRWTTWMQELHEVIDEFAGGLVSVAAYYPQREDDIASWAR